MSTAISKAVRESQRIEKQTINAANKLRRLRGQLESLKRKGATSEIKNLVRTIEQTQKQLKKKQNELASKLNRLDILKKVEADKTPHQEVSELSGKFPILLFPIRLETRFFDKALLIRIFPDDIHIDQHDETLSEDEVKTFSNVSDGIDLDKPENRRAVFNALAQTYSAPRAAWILRLMFKDPDTQAQRQDGESLRVARAAALPDRFVAIGIRSNKQQFVVPGNMVPTHLPIGPDPTLNITPEQEVDPDTLLKDPGLLWMRDFNDAEAKGMAIRVEYDKHDKDLIKKGLDQLIVLGVRGSITPKQTVADIDQLFTAHRYTDGLGFVEQGTPSNNTVTALSGFQSGSFQSAEETLLPKERPVQPGDQSNDEIFTAALGIKDAETQHQLFGLLENAALREQVDAHGMNTVLWSVTGGYFLEQMMRPLGSSFSRAQRKVIGRVREHFIDHVRGRGPLPAIRIGDQPYGVLPVMSLADWKPGNKTEQNLDANMIGILLKLKRYWVAAIDQVPRVGNTEDPQKDLVEALGLQAVSDRFSVHPMLGPAFLKNTVLQYGPDGTETDALRALIATVREQLRDVFDTLGIQISDPLVGECIHALCDYRISGEVVQSGIESNTALLDPDYINWLLGATVEEIENEVGSGADSAERGVPLLYLLLRHAVLLELGNAIWEKLAKNSPGLPLIKEPELISIRNQPGNSVKGTIFDLIKRPASSGQISEGNRFLATAQLNPAILPLRFGVFWGALRHLSTLSAENLDELLRETLDLFSSRYDAWASSFATKRLKQLSKKSVTGRWIGAYGFVENLRPRKQRKSEGYIHAPSLNQAATAAVLYNGFLTHSDNANGEPLSMQLNSDQVRKAEALVDGLRQGISLSSLLGYRFERFLQDRSMQVHIFPFRKAYPGLPELHDVTGSDRELPPDSRVVDGLALVRQFNTEGYAAVRNRIASAAPNDVPPATGQTAIALKFGLNELQEHLDAMSDALMAESVHQLILGNPERSGAALDAMSGTGSPPPELHAMKTPRTGAGLTHRVLSAWKQLEVPTAPGKLTSLLPGLERWAGQWTGSLDQIVVGAEVAGRNRGFHAVSMEKLNLSALDLLFITGNAGRQNQWLTQRARQYLIKNIASPRKIEAVEIIFDRHQNLDPKLMAFNEIEPVLSALRNVLGSGRMLDPKDLVASNDPPPASLWEAKQFLKDLEKIVEQLRLDIKTLGKSVELLQVAPPNDVHILMDSVREALWKLVEYRIPEAIPLSLTDQDQQQLVDQGLSVIKLGSARIVGFKESYSNGFPAQINIEQRDQLKLAVEKLFGPGLPMVLPIVLESDHAIEIELAWDISNSDSLQGGDPTAADRWLHDMSPVRDRVDKFHNLRFQFGVTVMRTAPRLTVSQLPIVPGERWIALPQDDYVGEIKTSIVAQLYDTMDDLSEQAFEGWMMDEWHDLIPQHQETTGIGFHYDSPGSHAPNAILLAVPPDLEGSWTLDRLVNTVTETIELMKFRGVAGNQLDGLGQLLPALFVPENSKNDTVSTRLDRARPAPPE